MSTLVHEQLGSSVNEAHGELARVLDDHSARVERQLHEQLASMVPPPTPQPQPLPTDEVMCTPPLPHRIAVLVPYIESQVNHDFFSLSLSFK